MAAPGGRVRRRRQSQTGTSTQGGAPPPPPTGTDTEAPPLLVQVLGGNVVTSLSVLACLNTVDASALRRLHPAVAAAVAAVPWADLYTRVHDPTRWRAALPAATGMKLAAPLSLLYHGSGLAALGGVTVLDLTACWSATDDAIARLPVPPSLRTLSVSQRSIIDVVAIAGLPPSIRVLTLDGCDKLSVATSFVHLTCLHTLSLVRTPISNATLATLPPSLVSLNLHGNGTDRVHQLSPVTVFPHLPALRVLNVSYTNLGDASVASMPTGLEELSMVNCRYVTQRACLDHLTALRVLQSPGTDLSPVMIAACRARGCFAPADGMLVRDNGVRYNRLVPLPDGRLVSGSTSFYDCYGRVTLWEAAAGRGAVVSAPELRALYVDALAVLHDGHRVAIGVSGRIVPPGIVVWDTRDALHDRRVVTRATIDCNSLVFSLAVAHNGWLVVGCQDGRLRVVDVDAGAVVKTLSAHVGAVRAVAGLHDGRMASASHDSTLKLWDADTGACVAMLAGHTDAIHALAVLPDGRLASGSSDKTVRLWDTATGICVQLLTGHTHAILTLAVLPGNQLASLSFGGTIRVWDTRGAGGALARPPLVIESASGAALALLPGNRLVTGGDDGVYLWQLPPPRSST